VQACEACSQSHLRCEDEKPCSRCKKKSIPCRVPETSAADDSEVNELDAVHAAQDLLDLSHGFDYPSAGHPAQEENHPPMASKYGMPDHSAQFRHPPPTPALTVNAVINTPSHPTPTVRERSFTASSHVPPNVGALPTHHQYPEDTGNAMPYFDNSVGHFDHTPGIDPLLPDYFRNMPTYETFYSGQATPRGLLDMSFDVDVGLTDIDFGLLDQYNFQMPFAEDTPSTENQGPEPHLPESESVPVRADAFKQSTWRYIPQRNKDFGAAEQPNLAFPDTERDKDRRSHMGLRRPNPERLNQTNRDRMMALVLGTCRPENVRRISGSFPSIELLETLIHFFLTSPALDIPSWFHMPTFSPSEVSPEMLACIVAAGAVSTPDLPLRKLGFALHEASRMFQAKAFEADNTSIRDLQHLRTLLLELHIGMWSGISRKMEISESFLKPLMTMLRRGSRFRRSTWKQITPPFDDQSSSLESTWHEWIHQESYLRLVYRAFELDRQSSMALLKPPLISYSEMQLPLPSSNNLWQAKTASAWRQVYLNSAQTNNNRPSALATFLDLEHLARYEGASTTYLDMIWGMIWEYRQMSSLCARSFSKANNSLILSSRYQDLVKQLDDFRVSCPTLSRSDEITLELMLVHLNAPLDDIQLFAGLEGQEEARNAYPALREWVKTAAARQALWHAGQLLRAAEGLPGYLLCNFNAIAVYHAGLILWGYGFLKRSVPSVSTPGDNPQSTVVLNDEDSLNARRFITLNRGNPTIRRPGSHNIIQLSDVSGVMDGFIHLLQTSKDSGEGSSPPLVGNLVQLIEGLRAATR
jgi:hypothetical protein